MPKKTKPTTKKTTRANATDKLKKLKGNKKKIKEIGYNFTKNQLKEWGVSYNELIMFKPSYDLFVDDKAIGFSKNWMNTLKKKLKIKN